MFSMLRISVADYILINDENEKKIYIDMNKLNFHDISINPFCVMCVTDVSDNVVNGNKNDISCITLSDGNLYLVKMSHEEAVKKVELSINDISLPF